MKTKTSLWLGVCTLVLCLGVMTFGVYSAISANLNIGGTLGFNMHNAVVTVSGKISNLAEMTTVDGVTYADKVEKTIESTIMGGENTTTANIDIGALNFYQGAYTDPETSVTSLKTYDIVFEISFTNLHTKAIIATIPLPTVGSNVTVIHGTENGYTDLTSYAPTISKDSSVTVTFALRLTNTESTLTNISFNWANIKFEEDDSWEHLKYSEDIGWHIELGKIPTGDGFVNEGEGMRWIPFAESTDGDNYSIFNSKTTKPERGKYYYFITEYLTSTYGSTNMVYRRFYYSLYATSNPPTNYDDKYNKVAMCHYAVSDLRAYLKSDSSSTITHLGIEKNFLDYYSIKSDDIYKGGYIKNRPLSELYETDDALSGLYGSDTMNYNTFISTYSSSKYPELYTPDYFWAPSFAELTLINGQEGVTVTNGSTYSNLIAKENYDLTTVQPWFTRSGEKMVSGTPDVYLVSTNGTVEPGPVKASSQAIRPCCEILIPTA